ncbi:MAG: glycerol-3-phosphate acyltransferase [Chloroflexi bacterium]|nr:glycerol-3-phosphate acyltransferase [Chloroflexota bacterium]
MSWIVIILGYLLGSIPFAYIAGRILRGRDIRQMGDRNVGAANAFRQLGRKVGVAVYLADAAKGALAILIARAASIPQEIVLLTGVAAVAGHNWSVFLGFRGGRGMSTAIGVLYAVVTVPTLIMTGPGLLTLVLSRNVILTSAVVFIPLPLVSWWLGFPGMLIAYSIALPCLVGLTHFLTTRRAPAVS